MKFSVVFSNQLVYQNFEVLISFIDIIACITDASIVNIAAASQVELIKVGFKETNMYS